MSLQYRGTPYRVVWDKIFKNGPSKICGRQPLKNCGQILWRLSSTNFIWSIFIFLSHIKLTSISQTIFSDLRETILVIICIQNRILLFHKLKLLTKARLTSILWTYTYFLFKQLVSGLNPQSVLYFQGFQSSKLLNGCLMFWPSNLRLRGMQ